jgi:hypothetical protein
VSEQPVDLSKYSNLVMEKDKQNYEEYINQFKAENEAKQARESNYKQIQQEETINKKRKGPEF